MESHTIDPENEEELMGAVADALCAEGLNASSQDTAGGVVCVVIEREDGGEIAWGLADVNWGASITDEDGEYISGIQTECPGYTSDVAKIVEALKGPSLSHGARLQPA
jgi:hypothetical protein